MGNFLGDLGAAIRGNQEYQTFLQQQESNKLSNLQKKAALAELEDLTAQKQADRARQADVGRYTLDYLGRQVKSLPPPPQQMPPMPGQQSVPMEQPPTMKFGQVPMGIDYGIPQGLPPPPMGMSSGEPQGFAPPMVPMGEASMLPQSPPMPPEAPQTAPQGPPTIPPYQTVGGAAGGPQAPQGMQGPQGIPPPPMPPMPAPQSMSIQDAAQFIKAQGISDPITGMRILENLTPYLNRDAQQEAVMLKMQLVHQDKEAALEQQKRQIEALEKRKDLDRNQKAELDTAKLDLQKQGIQLRKEKQSMGGGGKGSSSGGATASAAGGPAPGVEAAAWNYLIKGQNPPAKGGLYGQTMAYVEQIAKDNGMSVQELSSASADVKTRLAAKSKLETRIQNMERAENQILSEIPLIRDNMKGLNISSIPLFQKGGLAALRAMGDPRVTQLDQSLTTVFNEFEGIRTGNPSTLNVSDVQNAKHDIENARTEAQLNSALNGIEKTIARAKAASHKTQANTMTEINAVLGKKGGTAAPQAPKKGDVMDGYRFKGGDAHVKSNWEKV